MRKHIKKGLVMLRRSGERRAWTAVLAALTAGVSLVACGSSSSGGGTATKKISFGDLGNSPTMTPFYAAQYEGFFKKAGLNVSVEKFTGGGSSSVAALATGAVDVASGGPTNFIGDIAKKAVSGKIFAEVAGADYDILTGKGVSSVSQLKGQKIGVSGGNSADEIYLIAALSHYGIKPADVTFITAGTPAERLSAVSNGTIKATAEADTQRSVEQSVGSVVLKSQDSPVQVPGQTLYATSSFLKNDPAALKQMISVLVSATKWVSRPANKKAAVADCEKGTGATAASCEQTLAASSNPTEAGKWTWSTTWAVDTAGITQAIAATAQAIPEAKGLTATDVVDSSVTGTQP
jgi:ABC-type nitrate/sulfonate/bicarbonate transport system substrate-binding protein